MTLALYAVTSLLMLLAGAHGAPEAGGDGQIPAAYGMQGWELVSHRAFGSDIRDGDSSFANFHALRGVRRLRQTGSSDDKEGNSNRGILVSLWQLVYGAIYYCLVVQKYPPFEGSPTEKSKETQGKNEVTACLTCENSFVINLTACLCPAGRAAHTYDKLGLLPYWPGLCLSSFFPCCTLCYMNAATDLNEKLGGEKRNIFMACLCSMFCSCCVIAQDAQSLDDCTGATVTLCGVATDARECLDGAGATEYRQIRE